MTGLGAAQPAGGKVVSELVSQRTWATQAGTKRFVARHGHGKAPSAYSSVGGQLYLSALGIGTYLGAADDITDERYEEALVEAVRQGINVIDTASNYRNGRSEQVVGRALRRLFEMREIYRSEVLVSSKVGVLSGCKDPGVDASGVDPQELVRRQLAPAEELACGCHCIAPRYLKWSLETSLRRLGLETLDVYMLHNPEIQLLQVTRSELLDRVRRAFEQMERFADEGKIRVYGVSSWTGLRARREEQDYLGLEELVQCAEDVAGRGHRFRALQLPLNIRQPEALTWHQQTVKGRDMSALQAAQALGMVVFTTATLQQGRLCGGAPPEPRQEEGASASQGQLGGSSTHRALQFSRSAPGVTSALVGMSEVAHVRENVQTLAYESATPEWTIAAAQRPTGAAIAR